ncbi:P-loop containing nucleoside triphosphate hydrolase protein [Amylostereum chailletii]|nr:P-loop containing nucleoside triphosphate hydrolase protein [Amylostereum chailletii]
MLNLTHRHCLGLRRAIRAYTSAATTPTDPVFVHARSAEFLAGAAAISSIPKLHGLPEVIVTGRANSGKSTLLNAVVGRRDLMLSSKQPGRTKTLNFFRVGHEPGKLIVVDAPGYGARGRPEWGDLFDHYLKTRSELRRVYILFNAKHGINKSDRQMLQELDAQCQLGISTWTLQAVITKADSLNAKEMPSRLAELHKNIFEVAPTCLPPLVTAALKHPRSGIEGLRRSISEACDLLARR